MKVRVPRYEGALSPKEKERINIEIRKQIAEADRQHNTDIDAMILYTLHTYCGWGKQRLRAFYDEFRKNNEELIKHYEMEDGCYVARQALLTIGVDIEAWNDEISKETIA